MLSNCDYNKVKLLHELSRISGFLKRHAQKDARSAKHKECAKFCAALQKDVEKHIGQIQKHVHKLGKK